MKEYLHFSVGCIVVFSCLLARTTLKFNHHTILSHLGYDNQYFRTTLAWLLSTQPHNSAISNSSSYQWNLRRLFSSTFAPLLTFRHFSNSVMHSHFMRMSSQFRAPLALFWCNFQHYSITATRIKGPHLFCFSCAEF